MKQWLNTVMGIFLQRFSPELLLQCSSYLNCFSSNLLYYHSTSITAHEVDTFLKISLIKFYKYILLLPPAQIYSSHISFIWLPYSKLCIMWCSPLPLPH